MEAHPEGCLFWGFPVTIPYTKPAKTLDEQVALLVRRGLLVSDPADLKSYLGRVSYYRLRGFTYPFQDNAHPDHPFLPGTTWERIKEIAQFDHDLRVVVLDAMEAVEVALRTRLVLEMSLAHGGWWYENAALFSKPHLLLGDPIRPNKKGDLARLDEEWSRSHDDFVKHYRQKYDPTVRPPAWMMFETTSFGQVSKFLENLNTSLTARKNIAQYFGFSSSASALLCNWVHHLNVTRNHCAHHARLWNRPNHVKAQFPKNVTGSWVDPWPDSGRVWATLCILLYLTNRIDPSNKLVDAFRVILERADSWILNGMGVPPNWKSQPLWDRSIATPANPGSP